MYDGNGNNTQITWLYGTANATAVNYVYNPTFNKVSLFTDALSHSTQFSYDAHGDLHQVVDANNNSVTLAYDTLGRLVTLTII